MKSKVLQRSVAVGVGAVLLFAVLSARADEPKHKRHTQAEKSDDYSVTPAKPDRKNQIATRDGKHSTSADGGVVGGANGQETRVPTGSQIPQTYHRHGYTTDRSDPAFIYDKNDQRLQQSINVQDSLRNVPGVTIQGMR